MNHQPLTIDPEKWRKEQERQHLTNMAASTGGLLGGSITGALLINPYNYLKQRQAEAEAQSAVEIFKHNQSILRKLHELHTGAESWDNINPEVRETMEALYQEHLPLLSNPLEVAKELRRRPPADIIHVPGIPRFRWSQMLPSKEMLQHPIQTLQHPIPASFGLIGAGLAEYAMERHNTKRMQDLMQAEEGEK